MTRSIYIFRSAGFLIFSLFVLFKSVDAQNTEILRLENHTENKISIAGFRLDGEQRLRLTGRVPEIRSSRRSASAWLLNSQTRQVVWKADAANLSRDDRYSAVFDESIDLKPGLYEVYLSTYTDGYFFNFRVGHQGFFDWLFNGDDRWDHSSKDWSDLFFAVEGKGTKLSKSEIIEAYDLRQKSLLFSAISLRDDDLAESWLQVDQPVGLDVYGLGEARPDGNFDTGWIMDMKSRKKVWELTYNNSDWAGGNEKNRESRELVKLEPGLYEIEFHTDDSHSYQGWNSAPPFDPLSWGMQIALTSPSDQNKVRRLETEPEGNFLARINRIGDNERRSMNFSLKQDTRVHILAIGEGSGGEMYDFAEIRDRNTGRLVWHMIYRETGWAGGARKNRQADETILLEAGEYILSYESDDSHSYKKWNDDPPADPSSWGVTLIAAGDK